MSRTVSQAKAAGTILQEVIRQRVASPSERLHAARQAARCIHVRANGVRCGCPAMREMPWCFFHERIHTRPYEEGFPPLEDAASIQLALMQVLDGLRRGKLEPRVANSLLFGLQTASANLKHNYGSLVPSAAGVVTVDPLDELHETRQRLSGSRPRRRGSDALPSEVVSSRQPAAAEGPE